MGKKKNNNNNRQKTRKQQQNALNRKAECLKMTLGITYITAKPTFTYEGFIPARESTLGHPNGDLWPQDLFFFRRIPLLSHHWSTRCLLPESNSLFHGSLQKKASKNSGYPYDLTPRLLQVMVSPNNLPSCRKDTVLWPSYLSAKFGLSL